MMSKIEAREAGKKYRSRLDPEFVQNASIEADRNLQSTVDWAQVSSINIYQQIHNNNEIGTDSFISWLEENYPNVDVHRQSHQPIFPTDSFDVIVIPALAVDRRGVRVGYGGGSYDKYLADHTGATIIALCFEGQVVDEIDSESHDVNPDILVTESEVRLLG